MRFKIAWDAALPTIKWRLWQIKHLGTIYKALDAWAPKWYKEAFRPKYTTRTCMMFGHDLDQLTLNYARCQRKGCGVIKVSYSAVPVGGVIK